MMTQIEKPKEVQEFELLQRQACAMYDSGLFPDLKSKAQAVVKAMFGKELKLPPFASITGLHIVAGKLVVGANLIATMIANHPHYSYKIKKSTKEICEIDFYKTKSTTADNFLGSVSFTIQEAQEASLLGKDNWKKYPSDMLFARAISRGAKRYAPGIFGGSAVYTPDELNLEHDEDGVIKAKYNRLTELIDKEEAYQKDEHSDEKIIEEFKETHAISEGGI